MQLYVVGGAVRDRLLGLPATDRDWVAVGATPEELLALGYKPVGRDFPVFLHPQTGEEVALARTERKTGRGYAGFSVYAAPGVTLEQDLARRDLTINAIAEGQDGTLIDPYGGQADLRAKVLRHVSPAFVEDPVRLLRLARFAARFPDFTVAPETEALLLRMVATGEVDALVPERVWQELARGLMSARPSRMIEVLDRCGAWQRLFRPVEPAVRVGRDQTEAGSPSAPSAQSDPALAHLARVAGRGGDLAARWACLMLGRARDAGDARAASTRLRAPQECVDAAVNLVGEWPRLLACETMDAHGWLGVLHSADAFRRPGRLHRLALVCEAADEPAATRAAAMLLMLLPVAASAGAAAARDAAQGGGNKPNPASQIGERVRAARLSAIARTLRAHG